MPRRARRLSSTIPGLGDQHHQGSRAFSLFQCAWQVSVDPGVKRQIAINHFRSIAICLASLLLSTVAGIGGVIYQAKNPSNGHRYLLLSSATWEESEREAVRLGGHLATIRSRSELLWIHRTFGRFGGQARLLWIGLNDIATEGGFVWSSGEVSAYRAWTPGEPNNAGTGEDFVALYYPGHDAGGLMNDWGARRTDPIGIPFNGVVEVLPAPMIRHGDFGFLTNGLVAAYSFLGNAEDESGRENHGQLLNVEFVPDRFGTPGAAASFNGVDSAVYIAGSPLLDMHGTTGLTVSTWIRPETLAEDQGIVSKWGPGSDEDDQFWISLQSQQRRVRFLMDGQAPEVLSQTTIVPGRTYHLVAVYSPEVRQMRLYVNGQLNASWPLLRNIRSTSQRLVVGNSDDGKTQAFTGAIDNMRIYNRGLSADEVRHLHAWQANAEPWLSMAEPSVLWMLLKPGKRYRIERSVDLQGWTHFGNPFLANREIVARNVTGAERGYFRVKEE